MWIPNDAPRIVFLKHTFDHALYSWLAELESESLALVQWPVTAWLSFTFQLRFQQTFF